VEKDRVSILGVESRDPPPDFGQGVVGVLEGLGGRRSLGGRGRVVKYYYILLCTGSMFESGDF